MPRDGSNIYSQPDPDVVADTTIESAKYNNFTNDVAQDLNTPRPIVAGGTGATTAAGAIANLGGENANQVVTNYDSFPFVAGSFHSAAGATSAPTANAFAGICYAVDANNMFIEARDTTTGISHIRNKATGVWGAWTRQDYVSSAGSTMTGTLFITMSDGSPAILLTGPSGQKKSFRVSTGDLQIINNAGTNPIAVLTDLGSVNLTGDITAGYQTTTGKYYFGNSAAKYLNFDGTNFNFFGGQVVVPGLYSTGNVQSVVTATTGVYHFGSSGTKFLTYDSAKFNFTGGVIECGTGVVCRSGISGSYSADAFNLFWNNGGGVVQMWINAVNLGNITISSDYRIKKDVADLPSTWKAVKSLRPIKYTQKSFKDLFADDDVERWGFVAHELQETLTPSAATGEKDSPDTVQSPNPFTLIAALTKALQEAMTRIEALEAR